MGATNNGNSTTDAATKVWEILQAEKSWLTQRKSFKKALDSSFDVVDADKSGNVTLDELYAGLLLIHLKMASYVGAPACEPASKDYVTEMFNLIDTNDGGTLNKEEFTTVVTILYSQVLTRVAIHWLLTLTVVPLIAHQIIEYSVLFYARVHDFLKDADDELDPMQRMLGELWALCVRVTPAPVAEFACNAFSKVPERVWNGMPFTVVTLVLTAIALPYALKHMENLFRREARRDERKYKIERGLKFKEN